MTAVVGWFALAGVVAVFAVALWLDRRDEERRREQVERWWAAMRDDPQDDEER